jgi:hypothetical protein
VTPRKRIPKLGRWPTNPAAVWKLAAAHWREVALTRAVLLTALQRQNDRLRAELEKAKRWMP